MAALISSRTRAFSCCENRPRRPDEASTGCALRLAVGVLGALMSLTSSARLSRVLTSRFRFFPINVICFPFRFFLNESPFDSWSVRLTSMLQAFSDYDLILARVFSISSRTSCPSSSRINKFLILVHSALNFRLGTPHESTISLACLNFSRC